MTESRPSPLRVFIPGGDQHLTMCKHSLGDSLDAANIENSLNVSVLGFENLRAANLQRLGRRHQWRGRASWGNRSKHLTSEAPKPYIYMLSGGARPKPSAAVQYYDKAVLTSKFPRRLTRYLFPRRVTNIYFGSLCLMGQHADRAGEITRRGIARYK